MTVSLPRQQGKLCKSLQGPRLEQISANRRDRKNWKCLMESRNIWASHNDHESHNGNQGFDTSVASLADLGIKKIDTVSDETTLLACVYATQQLVLRLG